MMSLNINKKFLVTAPVYYKRGVFPFRSCPVYLLGIAYVLLTSLKIKTCPTGVWDINLNGI